MKVCVIQPYYSQNSADTEKCFRDMLALMDQCDDSMDLIVLPESCTTPAAVNADEYYEAGYDENGDPIYTTATSLPTVGFNQDDILVVGTMSGSYAQSI